MAPALIQDALASYRSAVEREFPSKLERLVLFGSWARGEATEDSDVDVLVLLCNATFAERARVLDLGALIGLERELPIAPLVLTRAEWNDLERRERLLPREIGREGIDA